MTGTTAIPRSTGTDPIVYVGAYTSFPPDARGRAAGLGVYRLARDTGALTHLQTAPEVANPSFIALHPRLSVLYTVNEASTRDGQPAGTVSAFARDPSSGALTFLNQQSTHGADPCYVSVDATGRAVLVANYSSGSVVVLPVGADGRIEPASTVRQHAGASVHPRQAGPHAHSILPDPTNRYALAADLGLDQVLVYDLDPARGALQPHEPPALTLAPGSGPRHLAFHPHAPVVYVINELASTLTACAWDEARGTLAAFQTVSTLPESFTGENTCADLHVAPSGRFVYGSNRGHDSIAVFACDSATGALTPNGRQATGGRTPRNFAIDPTGTFLLAANQESDTIVTFRLDETTGQPVPTGVVTPSPSPVCLQIVPPE